MLGSTHYQGRKPMSGWRMNSQSITSKRSGLSGIWPSINILGSLTSLRPKIGDQNYDAEIINTSSGKERITPVEFTSGYRDEFLALREECLPQHGVVPMNGPIWRDGTKASGGQIHVEPHWGDDQSRFEHLVATCEKRMAKKLGKGRFRRSTQHHLGYSGVGG